MSISDPHRSGARSSKDNYATTRRGLVAAAAVFGAMMVGQVKKANAFALPPDWRRPRGSGPSCFLRGTRILTPNGEVRIEELAIGDPVTTVDGSATPITWVGHWSYPRTSGENWPEALLPVKIVRSALAPSVPHTDLYLSQEHALYFDGILIPARRLVNGRSIVLCKSVEGDTLDYFHIRLAQQDVIFSEGAHSESYDDVSTLPDHLVRALPSNRMSIFHSRVRSAVSPWIDRRRPGDAVWERLAARAETHVSV